MGTKTFSKKEALTHGIEKVKKFFGVIFVVVVIYAAFELGQWLIEKGAGIDYISRSEIRALYKDPQVQNTFTNAMQQAGYINAAGKVQDKLNTVKSAADLNLPASLQSDRQRIYEMVKMHQYHLPFPKAVYYVLLFAFWLIGMLFQVGMTKLSLMISRDEAPSVKELFSNGRLLLAFIVSTLCYTLAVLGGAILLIVPGIILAIAMEMNQYLIVDQNMGPIEALTASRALTKGARWQLFCFGALLILFNIAGALCLLVGLIFTVPASAVAMAYVYDQLRAQSETTA